MHISPRGEVLDYSFHNSVIHSKERMTYDDVQKIIDGDPALTARYEHDSAADPEDRTARANSSASAGRNVARSTSICPNRCLPTTTKGDVTGIVKSDTLLFASHHRRIHDPRQ